MNQELKEHITILERSNEEHKRIARKREKDLDQMTNECEHNIKNASSLTTKVFI
jgi:hypothetical protein